jgi:hypothetical protein
MGGYVVSYPGDFHYLTIRGSGHMVVRRHMVIIMLTFHRRIPVKIVVTHILYFFLNCARVTDWDSLVRL